MSLYRVASRRGRLVRLLAPVVALLAGIAIGFVVGRSTTPEPSLAEALEQPAAAIRTARNALELLTIEYPQAVRNGEVSAPTEYEAARADVRRARDAFEAARADLDAIAADAVERADVVLLDLALLVERKAPLDEVLARVREADDALAALPGG